MRLDFRVGSDNNQPVKSFPLAQLLPVRQFSLRNVDVLLAVLVSLTIAAHAADKSQTLFNGKDLAGWRQPSGEWKAVKAVTLDLKDDKLFALEPGQGVLVNGAKGRTPNLISEFKHGDVEAHIEFVVPKGANSGVYFQGRYEIQVFDSWGVREPKYSDCGGIYQRWVDDKGFEGHAPRVNASKPPGEWQTFDVVFRAPRFNPAGRKIANARFIKVTLNGQVIHENVEVTGPTRAATFENDEQPTGPLMLQGDHGPVAYRNLKIEPRIHK